MDIRSLLPHALGRGSFIYGLIFLALLMSLVPVSGLPPTLAITFCCAKK